MKILHYRADLRSVAFILTSLALFTVQWTGVVRHPALWAASFALAFLACVVNHNHQHHPTFARGDLNCVFGVLVSLAIGAPACSIIPMHNMNHHVHNNLPADFVRASLVRFRWKPLNLIAFPFVAIAGYLKAKTGIMRSWRRARPRLFRQLVLERLALYSILPAMLIVHPLETLAYVVAPCLFGQWAILAINHLQHVGCDPGSEYAHSRNFTGRCLNWWMMNNGFHTVHHLSPHVHWSLLPQVHQQIRSMIDPMLERKSLGVGLFEFYLRPGGVKEAS